MMRRRALAPAWCCGASMSKRPSLDRRGFDADHAYLLRSMEVDPRTAERLRKPASKTPHSSRWRGGVVPSSHRNADLIAPPNVRRSSRRRQLPDAWVRARSRAALRHRGVHVADAHAWQSAAGTSTTRCRGSRSASRPRRLPHAGNGFERTRRAWKRSTSASSKLSSGVVSVTHLQRRVSRPSVHRGTRHGGPTGCAGSIVDSASTRSARAGRRCRSAADGAGLALSPDESPRGTRSSPRRSRGSGCAPACAILAANRLRARGFDPDAYTGWPHSRTRSTVVPSPATTCCLAAGQLARAVVPGGRHRLQIAAAVNRDGDPKEVTPT